MGLPLVIIHFKTMFHYQPFILAYPHLSTPSYVFSFGLRTKEQHQYSKQPEIDLCFRFSKSTHTMYVLYMHHPWDTGIHQQSLT